MINAEGSNDDQSSSDSEIAVIEDGDTCRPEELQAQFQGIFNILDESAVSLKNDFILSLGSDNGLTRVAAGLSNGFVQLFDVESCLQSKHLQCLPPTTAETNICRVRFLDETPNLLLVGTTNGLIRLFDLRTNQEQARFEHDEKFDAGDLPPMPKSITCFDRNANSRVLCAGTEQFQHNVFLQFFDVRERKFLGGYYESHEDDVTAVLFHDRNPDLLCTGATDGLINVFDIKAPNEDDALLNTINTESSVQRLNWHKNVYEKDIVSCITHTNDFKAYECQEGDEFVSFDRADITAGIRRKNVANFNLINAHNMHNDEVFLLAGTNFNKGEILRSTRIVNKSTLQPLANFNSNKQIVRESLFDVKKNLLITGGECGIVTVWTMQTAVHPNSKADGSKKSKTRVKQKSEKRTPY